MSHVNLIKLIISCCSKFNLRDANIDFNRNSISKFQIGGRNLYLIIKLFINKCGEKNKNETRSVTKQVFIMVFYKLIIIFINFYPNIVR